MVGSVLLVLCMRIVVVEESGGTPRSVASTVRLYVSRSRGKLFVKTPAANTNVEWCVSKYYNNEIDKNLKSTEKLNYRWDRFMCSYMSPII